MNYLLNMGYTLPNSFIEMPSSLGLISYIVGPHVKRYRYIDDVTKYNLYLEKILQGMNILEDTYKSITSLSSETRSFLNTSISSGLSKLSSEDLIKLYNTYLKRYTQMVFSSFVLRMIDRGIILYVTKHWEYNQDGILAHMSAMTTYSHALQEERDIADIAQLLLTDTYDSEDSMIQEKIQSLVENYAWIGL